MMGEECLHLQRTAFKKQSIYNTLPQTDDSVEMKQVK